MVPNPFIEFARDPVGILAWSGYVLLLGTFALMAARSVLRGVPTQYTRWKKNRSNKSKWWRIGDMSYGVVPPLDWTLKTAWHILTVVVFVWAAGALLWVLGV